MVGWEQDERKASSRRIWRWISGEGEAVMTLFEPRGEGWGSGRCSTAARWERSETHLLGHDAPRFAAPDERDGPACALAQVGDVLELGRVKRERRRGLRGWCRCACWRDAVGRGEDERRRGG